MKIFRLVDVLKYLTIYGPSASETPLSGGSLYYLFHVETSCFVRKSALEGISELLTL